MRKVLTNQKVAEILAQMPFVKRVFFSAFGALVLTFLFLSLLSYNTLDPAWSHVGERQEISNVGGKVGAWLADILHVFFGMGAWWLVVVMVYELVLLWWRNSEMLWQLRVLTYGFLLVCISGLLASWGAVREVDIAFVMGGVLGVELYQGLLRLVGATTATMFLLIVIIVVVTLVFEVRCGRLFRRLMGWLDNEKTNSAKVDANNAVEHDEVMFEVVKSELPSSTASQENLSEFLHTSGLREQVLTGQNTTNKVEIHADEVVLKVDNLTLDSQSVASTQPTNTATIDVQGADSSHHSKSPNDSSLLQINETLNAMSDDELIEVLNHDFDGSASALMPKSRLKIINNHFERKQTTKKADTKTHCDTSTSDDDNEADFVYQNKQNNKIKPMSCENVFDNAWVDLSENLLNSEVNSSNDVDNEHGGVELNLDDELLADDEVESILENDLTIDVVSNKPDLFDESKPNKSRAMDTLAYRMSLPPLPELSILDKPDANKQPSYTEQELMQLSELLEIKLREFNIKADVVSAMVGPVVTRFEVELAPGIKASRVTGASQDLARSLSMASLRVVEVIPGKPYIGIEVPNKKREMVRLIELLDTPDYKNPDKQIGIAIGKDIGGNVVIADLAKAPHMLVAGTTGSGKSVFVNSILLSMLFKYTPDELKLVLIDPKQLELANYGDIPHLLTPVITDMTEATAALTWCVNEMERRYQLMSLLKVRKISEFNKKVINAEKAGEPIFDPLWRADENVSIKTAPKLKTLPLIVIVADEFADMIMQLGKTAEEPIVRLAQKARAAGIHLVLATQRPTVNVVTGLIKANIPSRVALRVNSKVDSRTIIEEGGAENMLGNGDMMFIGPGENTPRRVHGAYVDDDEVNRVCDAWRERGSPDYIDLSSSYTFEGEGSSDGMGLSKGGDDEYYHQAVTFVMESRKVSISSIQRKLGIGYNRAARIVDMMEEAGLVSPMDNTGKRQILM